MTLGCNRIISKFHMKNSQNFGNSNRFSNFCIYCCNKWKHCVYILFKGNKSVYHWNIIRHDYLDSCVEWFSCQSRVGLLKYSLNCNVNYFSSVLKILKTFQIVFKLRCSFAKLFLESTSFCKICQIQTFIISRKGCRSWLFNLVIRFTFLIYKLFSGWNSVEMGLGIFLGVTLLNSFW